MFREVYEHAQFKKNNHFRPQRLGLNSSIIMFIYYCVYCYLWFDGF